VKINEIFTSIQGEGVNTGIPTTFIRLQGCNVGCSWCDTKESWNNNEGIELSIDSIINKIETKNVCITGGEPCLQDLTELTNKLDGYYLTLETSGTSKITGDFDWITLSPKLNFKPPLKDSIFLADEIKFPVGKQSDLLVIKDFLLENKVKQGCIILLQPISLSNKATQLCIDTCIENNWRLSIQAHKFINVQ